MGAHADCCAAVRPVMPRGMRSALKLDWADMCLQHNMPTLAGDAMPYD